jgi:pyruvate/2-oxoglutarate dehydrogenase complex dihydrolipoamide acyltransferase (E2) component
MIGPDGYNPATGKVHIIQADPVADLHIGPGDKEWKYFQDFRIGRLADDPAKAAAAATGPDSKDPSAWPKDATTEDARKTLDTIMTQRGDAGPANIKLNIVHKDAPSGTTVKADGDAFKGHSMEQTNKAPTPAKAPSHEFSGAELAAG